MAFTLGFVGPASLILDAVVVGVFLACPILPLLLDDHGLVESLIERAVDALLYLNTASIFTAPVATLIGAVALFRIRRSPQRHGGKRLALGGLVMGAAHSALAILVIALLRAKYAAKTGM